ncbi:MAG: hypothetical protein F6J92_23945 [Symploca sp. SIO1A3]|nr:hypothetical protein [Symploca sp. SIO1A3]
MNKEQVRQIYSKLPLKRRQVLDGFVKGHNKEKIKADADIPSDDALQQHLRNLYKAFKIETRWNDADDKRSGQRKLLPLIKLISDAMPELVGKSTPAINNRQQARENAPNVSVTQLLTKESNLSKGSPASLQGLDFSGIPQEKIEQAYQDSLPNDAEVWDLESNNLEQILNNLDELRQLDNFLELLIQDPDIPRESRNQLQVTRVRLAQKKTGEANRNKSSSYFFPHPSAQLDSYLLVTLTSDDKDKSQQFLLNAWLIRDDSVKICRSLNLSLTLRNNSREYPVH